MIRKVISVSQMAAVLGISLPAVREGIAVGKFPFAYAWQSPGKKSRAFVIDKEGFKYVKNTDISNCQVSTVYHSGFRHVPGYFKGLKEM